MEEVKPRYGAEFHRIKLIYKTPLGGEIIHTGLTSHKEAYDIAKTIKEVETFTVKQSFVMILNNETPTVEWANHIAENSDGKKYNLLVKDDKLVKIERVDDED